MNALFWAALAAGLSYWPASHLSLDPVLLVVWKGACVALLAIWAATRAQDADGWLLIAVLTLGAAGDVLLETARLEIGGGVFLVGHLVAIVLYLRNRRAKAGWWPLLLIPAAAGLATLLPADRTAAAGVGIYGACVAAMAACALMSRFRLAALGALMFVASDLLIFARLGPLADSMLPLLLVWPLYFFAQALIAWNIGRCRSA